MSKPDNKPSKRKIIYINGKPMQKRKISQQENLDKIGYMPESEVQDTDSYMKWLGQ